MAIIRTGPIVAGISGAIGGQVFVNAKTGLIVRPRPYRRPAATAPLLAQNAIFANTTRSWRSISPQQKNAWRSLASNFPTSNRIGQASAPTGFSLFVKVNALSASFLGPPILDPPLETNPEPWTVRAVAAFDIPNYFINIDRLTAPNLVAVQISANRSLSATRPKFPSPFRVVATEILDDPTKAIINFTSAFISSMGPMALGEAFTLRVRFYSPALQLLPTPALEFNGVVLPI